MPVAALAPVARAAAWSDRFQGGHAPCGYAYSQACCLAVPARHVGAGCLPGHLWARLLGPGAGAPRASVWRNAPPRPGHPLRRQVAAWGLAMAVHLGLRWRARVLGRGKHPGPGFRGLSLAEGSRHGTGVRRLAVILPMVDRLGLPAQGLRP